MKSLTTFAFVVRWQLIPFILGLAMVCLSAAFLIGFTPDPPGRPFQSVPDMVGWKGGVFGMVVGAAIMGIAWAKAAALRSGKRTWF